MLYNVFGLALYKGADCVAYECLNFAQSLLCKTKPARSVRYWLYLVSIRPSMVTDAAGKVYSDSRYTLRYLF